MLILCVNMSIIIILSIDQQFSAWSIKGPLLKYKLRHIGIIIVTVPCGVYMKLAHTGFKITNAPCMALSPVAISLCMDR